MNASRGETCLVTGGAGFIGAHVSRGLIQEGYNVLVLDNLSGGFTDNVPEEATFIQADITDHEAIARVFNEHGIDYVYHLAAYAAEGLSHFIRRFNYNNNLIGSINLINESVKHEVKCFVFTSSIAVYGAIEPPMSEDQVPEPEDPYGVAKLAVEHDLKTCHEMFGMPYVIFRPHNVYGEYQNIGDKYRNVIGIFMNQLMQDQPMTIFGDGTQSRAFSYIGDAVPAMARAIRVPEAYNQVFNIGADTPYAVNTLAEVVSRAMNREVNIRHLPARNEVMHAYPTHDKVKRILGFEDTTTLEEGIQRMADWAMRVGSRSSQEFEAIEITRNFPKGWLKSD